MPCITNAGHFNYNIKKNNEKYSYDRRVQRADSLVLQISEGIS